MSSDYWPPTTLLAALIWRASRDAIVRSALIIAGTIASTSTTLVCMAPLGARPALLPQQSRTAVLVWCRPRNACDSCRCQFRRSLDQTEYREEIGRRSQTSVSHGQLIRLPIFPHCVNDLRLPAFALSTSAWRIPLAVGPDKVRIHAPLFVVTSQTKNAKQPTTIPRARIVELALASALDEGPVGFTAVGAGKFV